jgi:hypothetical protein
MKSRTAKQKRATTFNFSRSVCKGIVGQLNWIIKNIESIEDIDPVIKRIIIDIMADSCILERRLMYVYWKGDKDNEQSIENN